MIKKTPNTTPSLSPSPRGGGIYGKVDCGGIIYMILFAVPFAFSPPLGGREGFTSPLPSVWPF